MNMGAEKRVTNGRIVQAHGIVFPSIMSFCNHYGLHYPLVQHYLRRGISPEEIILQSAVASNKGRQLKEKPGRHYLCEYDGVQYQSLSEAAEILGLSLSWLYNLKKKHQLSASAALNLAMEKKRKTPKNHIVDNRKPCVVDGRYFESQTAALRAFQIPQITVYSRMQREGITFEEALMRGRKDRQQIKPIYSGFKDLHLHKVDSEEFTQIGGQISAIYHDLIYSQRTCTCYRDYDLNSYVLQINEFCNPLQQELSYYIHYQVKESGPTGVLEFIAPRLFSFIEISEREEIVLLKYLNDVNSTYLNMKVFYEGKKQTVNASWSQIIKPKQKETKPAIVSFLHFIGNCEIVCESLQSLIRPSNK